MTAYRAGEDNPLAPLRVQYADYAHWQRQWLQGEVLEGQLSYWRGQLAGLPAVHGLPLDRPRKALQGTTGARYVQRLSKELHETDRRRVPRHGVTLFMFLRGGVRGAAEPLEPGAGHRRRLADRGTRPSGPGAADRLLRQHARAPQRRRGERLVRGAAGEEPADDPRRVRAPARAVRDAGRGAPGRSAA